MCTTQVHVVLYKPAVSLFRKPVEAVNGGPDGGPAGGPAGGAVPWQRVTLILELLQHKKKLKRAETLVPVLFTLLARYFIVGVASSGSPGTS